MTCKRLVTLHPQSRNSAMNAHCCSVSFIQPGSQPGKRAALTKLHVTIVKLPLAVQRPTSQVILDFCQADN